MSAADQADDRGARAGALLTAGVLAAVLVALLVAWGVLVAAHMDDRYRVGHVGGVRMALAQYTLDGVLYPPLYDGERFGGTRYMPVPILVHAGATLVTGDELIAGKLLGVGFVASLVAVTFVLARRRGAPPVIAAGLAATLVAADLGVSAGFGMRFDALPAVLQLAAVGLVGSAAVSAPALAAAAVLCALALLSKTTALWGAAAIGLWLLARAGQRRDLALFAGVFVAALIVVGGALLAVSDGRMLSNVVGLSTAGVGGISAPLHAVDRIVHALVRHARLPWIMLPFAFVGAVTAWRRPLPDPVVLGFVLQIPLLLAVFTDIGVRSNQLVDVAALAAVVVGGLVGELHARAPHHVAGVAGLMLAWFIGSFLVVDLVADARDAVALLGDGRSAAAPLADRLTADTTLLTDDPGIEVARDRHPVVLDPFMLPRLADAVPHGLADLEMRVDAGAFDLIALTRPLDDARWWRDYHFGEDIAAAIARSYRPAGTADGFYLYEPSAADD